MTTIKDIVLQDQQTEKDNGYSYYIRDVWQHGCVTGIVSGLIYYKDTTEFFSEHKDEINALLKEFIDSTGLSIEEIFGEKWDKEDPLAMQQYNQNLLAWFGYEETAKKIEEEQSAEY